MVCSKCGGFVPEGNKFCEVCGAKVESGSDGGTLVNENDFVTRVAPLSDRFDNVNPEPINDFNQNNPGIINEYIPIDGGFNPDMGTEYQGQADSKTRFCKKCGNVVDKKTKRCVVCGKKSSSAKFIIPIIILALLMCGFAGVNVYQYLLYTDQQTTIEDLETSITEKDESLDKNKTEISNNKKEIANQKDKIETLESEIDSKNDEIEKLETRLEESGAEGDDIKADYALVVEALKTSNLGYAANNFRTNSGVYVVSANEKNHKMTLTANWPQGGDVTFESVSGNGAAGLAFVENSWAESVQLTISPYHKGVTVFKFSNSVDFRTFNVVVIVTD